MPKFNTIPYKGATHGSFEEEWGLHKGCSEWWYATGYLSDETGKLYSYQFTVLRVRIASVLYPYLVMMALTDFTAGTHEYYQNFQLSSKGIIIKSDAVGYGDTAIIRKNDNGMSLKMRHKNFSLDLKLDYGKGAFWHCDGGLLQMGLPGKNETTVYYSYTNMPTSGTLSRNSETIAVSGKSWFDRQGGTYSLTNKMTNWEWFPFVFSMTRR